MEINQLYEQHNIKIAIIFFFFTKFTRKGLNETILRE